MATGRGRCPQYAVGAEISEQLFSGRRMVGHGRPRTVHYWPDSRGGSYLTVHVRHACATRVVRATLPARDVPHALRTYRSGGHIGLAARHQCAHAFGGASADRSIGGPETLIDPRCGG